MKYQKVNYEGIYQSYKESRSNVQPLESSLNDYQLFLYNRALTGLEVYKPEHLKKMNFSKKERVAKVHSRAQKVLNNWKQELIASFCGDFLSTIFHHSDFVKEAKDESLIVENAPVNISFKDLKIRKSQIIEKLISEKILPPNFYQLDNLKIA